MFLYAFLYDYYSQIFCWLLSLYCFDWKRLNWISQDGFKWSLTSKLNLNIGEAVTYKHCCNFKLKEPEQMAMASVARQLAAHPGNKWHRSVWRSGRLEGGLYAAYVSQHALPHGAQNPVTFQDGSWERWKGLWEESVKMNRAPVTSFSQTLDFSRTHRCVWAQ